MRGGRTNAVYRYYKAKDGELILYYDFRYISLFMSLAATVCIHFRSLYPSINCCTDKDQYYPVGHPDIMLHGFPDDLKAADIFGLIKCTIMPPREWVYILSYCTLAYKCVLLYSCMNTLYMCLTVLFSMYVSYCTNLLYCFQNAYADLAQVHWRKGCIWTVQQMYWWMQYRDNVWPCRPWTSTFWYIHLRYIHSISIVCMDFYMYLM